MSDPCIFIPTLLSKMLGISTATQHKAQYNAIQAIQAIRAIKEILHLYVPKVPSCISFMYSIFLIILANFMNIQMKWTVYGLAKWNSYCALDEYDFWI